MIPVSRPQITSADKQAVTAALDDVYISGEAPPVMKLEQSLAEYLGLKHVVAVSTGTTAIDLVVESLDLSPGDQVVVPAFTIVSSVNALLRKGVHLKLVDADPVTWSMDSNGAASSMNRLTKLVLPVHIYGLPVDMDPITILANELGILVFEDAAEALGVEYKGKKCGALGDISAFSFFANKVVTGGEGGAIATNHDALAKRLRRLRNLSHSDSERFVHEELAWNARMPAIVAALIESQLNRIDSLLARKREIAARYSKGLERHPWFEFMPTNTSYSTNSFWVFPILTNSDSPLNVSQLRELLRSRGVDTRRFFCPIHLQPFAAKFQITFDSALSVSEKLWERGFYLPSGLGILDNEVDYVISQLWELSKT